jgi:hypothetical protein
MRRSFPSIRVCFLLGTRILTMQLCAQVTGAYWTFGFSLGTGPHSQPHCAFLVKIHEEKVIATEPISDDQWILQAKGLVASKANPLFVDLLLQEDVPLCNDRVEPETAQGMESNCDPLLDLWKLRHLEWPFALADGTTHGPGWSQMSHRPSDGQMVLLSSYGIQHLTDVVHGHQAFRLLRDMADPAWVLRYRKG